MELNELQLSQLIASRLNHDYVAPLTAISNSCELLQISPESTAECIELINESIETAIALLQYYRLAFGVYGSNEEVSFAEIKRRILDVIADNGVEVKFDYPAVAVRKSEAKLLALGLLCIRSSFLKLKKADVDYFDGRWLISGQGRPREDPEDIEHNENLWHDLAPIKASNVHFAVLSRELKAQGANLTRKSPNPSTIILELEV